jgi:hypothetical protein
MPNTNTLAPKGRRQAANQPAQSLENSGVFTPLPRPAPQGSGDRRADPLSRLLVNQLGPDEKRLAQEHRGVLTACLQAKDRNELRAWIAERAATEDIVGQIFAARRQALLRDNALSKPLLKALKEFDALASASHRRLLDLLELLRRLDQRTAASIRITEAHQVAIMADGGEDL